jgi:hypothetical protein
VENDSKFFIYVLMAGDFGKSIQAKIAKYKIAYVKDNQVIAAQP